MAYIPSWLRQKKSPLQPPEETPFNTGQSLGDLLTRYGQYVPGVGNIITNWQRAQKVGQQVSQWWERGTKEREQRQAERTAQLKKRRPGESLALFEKREGIKPTPEHILWTTGAEREPQTFNIGDLPAATLEAVGKGTEAWGKATTWLPRQRAPGETYEQFKESPEATAFKLPWTSLLTGKQARISWPGIAEMMTPDIVFPAGKAPKATQIVEALVKQLQKGVTREALETLLTTTSKVGRQYAKTEASDLLDTAERALKVGTKETVEFGARGTDIGVQPGMFGGQQVVRTTPSGAVEDVLTDVVRGKGEQLGLGERLGGFPSPGLKERWQMTQSEYLEDIVGGAKGTKKYGIQTDIQYHKEYHKYVVEEALKEGKPVPDEVLRAYPDLVSRTPTKKMGAPTPIQKVVRPTPSITGKETSAFGADPNKTYKMQYKVVELKDLVTSHMDNLMQNPNYPPELQPRIRNREVSRSQIEGMAAELNPDALLYDTRTLEVGPMIVGPDNIVESGNGRVMALRKAAQENQAKFQEYVTKLRQEAWSMGIDPKEVDAMSQPVLVRQRLTSVDRASFAAEANIPAVMSMSPFEQAVQDAGRLSDEVLARITVGEDQSIEQALKSSKNQDVVGNFLKGIPDTQRASISDAKGNINMAGIQRMKAALLAKVFSDQSGRRLAETFIESVDPQVKNIENALYKALPSLVKSESMVKAGKLSVDMSFAEDLAKVIDVFKRLREEGIKISDYITQIGMWEEELNDMQKLMLSHLSDITNRPKALREFFTGLADSVINLPKKGQKALIAGELEITKEGMLNGIITNQRKEFGEKAISITPKPASGPQLVEPVAGGAPTPRSMEPPVGVGVGGTAKIGAQIEKAGVKEAKKISEKPVEKRPAEVQKVADQLAELDKRIGIEPTESVPQATRGPAAPEPKYPWQELPGETLAEPTAGARTTPRSTVPPGPERIEFPKETTPYQPTMETGTPRVSELQSPYAPRPATARQPSPPRRPPTPPPPPPGAVPINPTQAARNPGNWTGKVVQWWRFINRRLNDDYFRLNQMGTRGALAQGLPLFRGVSKLEESLAVFRGMSGAAREAIRQTHIRVWDILDGSPQLLDEVGKYWEMRHQLEIMIYHGRQFYISGGRTISSSVIMRDLQAMEKRLGNINMKKIDDAARSLTDAFNRTMLKSHEIDLPTAQRLISQYQYYCPSIYNNDVIKMVARRTNISPNTIRDLISDIPGVARELKSPLDSFASTIASRMRINELNRIKSQLVDAALADPELAGLISVTDKLPKGGYFVDFYEQGARKYMILKEGAEWLGQDLQLLSLVPGTDTVEIFKNWGRWLNYPARFGSTVASIPFQIANIFNDYLTAFIREGIMPQQTFKGFIRSMRSVFSEDDVVNAWRLAGGEVAGFFGRSSDDVWRNVTKQGNYVAKNPRDLKRLMLDMLHATEMAARIATFERGGEMATLRSRRVTIDFDRAGDVMRILNAWYLFLNAGKEGFLLPFRSLRDNPKGVASRLSVLVALSTATYGWNQLNPAYERVPDGIKYGQFIIMLPSDKYDNYGKPVPKYAVIIPNMREWSMFTAPIIYLMRKLDEKKVVANLKDTFMAWYPSWSPMSNILSVGGGIQVPTQVGQTLSELAQNMDTYRNQPIVPDYLVDKPEAEQYDVRTSPMAITLGKALDWSPMKIDYAMNNLFGSLGRDVLYAVSQVIRAADKEIQDPGIQRYVQQLREINEKVPADQIESARVSFINSLDPETKEKVLTAERLPTDYIPLVSGVINRFYKNYPMSAPTPVYLLDQEAKLGTKIANKIYTTDDLAYRYDMRIKDVGREALQDTELGRFYLESADYVLRSNYRDVSPDERIKLRKSDPLLEAHLLFWGDLKLAENPRSMQWVKQWAGNYQLPPDAVPALQRKTGNVTQTPQITPEREKVYQPSGIYTPSWMQKETTRQLTPTTPKRTLPVPGK